MKIKKKEKDDGLKTTAPVAAAVASPPSEKVFFDNRIKRKNVLALNEKVAAIREYEKMPVYKRIGRMFHCSPDQIKRIVQQKDTILKAWEQRTRRCQDAKTLQMKVVRVSMLGKAVYDWIRRMMYYQDLMITDGLIQKTALQFKSAMGLLNFFPYQDWCDKFRQTYNITEIDSKRLKIGYTQGYSVQIKDVMKDVLSECTPDAVSRSRDDDEDDDDEYDDDGDGDDGGGGGGDGDGGSDQEIIGEGDEDGDDDNSKDENENDRRVSAKKSKTKSKDISNSSKNNNNHNNNATTTLKTAATTPATATTMNALPKLQPIRQLVALPLQPNRAGMPQKVLVATPITPAGQRVGNSPMTMTIIPLTTIGQQQEQHLQQHLKQQQQQQQLKQQQQQNVASEKQPTVPAPIVNIKQEIKQEPLDPDNEEANESEEIQIKQENITDNEKDGDGDDDDDDDVDDATTTRKKSHEGAGGAAKAKCRLSNDIESVDIDNLALSSLRQLIQNQNTSSSVVTTIPTIPTISTAKTTPTASVASQRPTLTIPISITEANRNFICGTNIPTVSLPPPPLIKAPTPNPTPPSPLPSPTTPSAVGVGSHSRGSTPTISVNRLANKRKHQADSTPSLPPIKSCAEARKYLKLLEDFALVKENFRLIGLITRADEVMRELDGDDDVDVD